MSYTKLFSDILASTIWAEGNATRIVWITMLAMANKDGEVGASIPGLAHIARVTLAECEQAIQALESPDPHSRTKAHEGRRIKKIDGGWFILNYEAHRERASIEERRHKDRLRQERKRQRDASRDVTPGNASHEKSQESFAFGDASASASVQEKKKQSIPKPDDVSDQTWADFKKHRKGKVTVTGINTLREKAREAGMTLEGAMEHMMANGHLGFFPPNAAKTGGVTQSKFGMRAVYKPEDYSKPENSWEAGAPK